jgi:hypothetical protein
MVLAHFKEVGLRLCCVLRVTSSLNSFRDHIGREPQVYLRTIWIEAFRLAASVWLIDSRGVIGIAVSVRSTTDQVSDQSRMLLWEQHVYRSTRPQHMALLRSAMLSCDAGYKHVAPPERRPKFKGRRPKNKIPSTKYKMRSTKYKMRSTKYKATSTKDYDY